MPFKMPDDWSKIDWWVLGLCVIGTVYLVAQTVRFAFS